jgi:CubicO group peptidase (beta-lactamase class C family)
VKRIIPVAAAFLLINSAKGSDQYDAIRQGVEHEVAAGHATGVAVALTHNGKIIWQEGFGWADEERGRHLTPDTPFSLASVTKPFATTALMVLVAASKVSLDVMQALAKAAQQVAGKATLDPINGDVRW